MPLESHLPVIDNRRYDDIMSEARTRIARYTPEWTPVWTDVNDSDPGITLVQVFAWLTEMLTFRLGQVPELNYLKFLQLLGIELNPAEPALTEITFPVLESYFEPYVIVPARTQVTAESDEGQDLIVFEAERALVALTARLASVQVFDGYAFADIRVDNEDVVQGFEPFGPLANPDSALMLGFSYDQEFPLNVELNLAVWAFEGITGPAAFQCGLPESQVYPSAQIAWEYWSDREWRSLNLLKDETQALTRSGHIYLKTPAKATMRRAVIGAVAEERYWIRGRLKQSQYERPPKLLAIRTNTVPAIQAETVRDEVLGGSDGSPNQTFRLANTPVLHDTLVLEVDEGDGFHEWTQVDDFFGSSGSDRYFVLNRTTGEIRFGGGGHFNIGGAIPVANVDNPGANVVAREYRFGGGQRGNVAAGALNTLLTSVRGIDENGITNLRAAHSGRDEESLPEAKLRAPRSLKSKCRAVAEEDFEHLALEAANIKRAKALSLYHPNFPDVKVPGVVTVIVVPDSSEPNPMPSEGTLRTVCAYLDRRRLLTTELYVVKPIYRRVEIRVGAIAEDNADLAEVKEGIEQTLLDYFHPLKGGEDNLGWPFGGDIYYSRAYQRVFTVAGVQRIEHLFIVVDGEEAPECRDVPIPDGVLVYSTEHEVQVNYAFDQ
jgi:predicted phage baseplate assembly protein